MQSLPQVPEFSMRTGLGVFLADLRSGIYDKPIMLARAVNMGHYQISKYESGKRTPQLGYLAYLAYRLEEELTKSSPQRREIRTALLREVNRAIRANYKVEPFIDWNELQQFALDFIEERRTYVVHKEDTASTLRQIPEPPPDFTGRTEALRELNTAFAQQHRSVCIQGMGGVGKTALALTFAQQISDWFLEAQLFLDMRGMSSEPVSAVEAMTRVLRTINRNNDTPTNEQELLAVYQNQLKGRKILLVLDNVADAQQIRSLVPPSSCFLIITTRKRIVLPGMFLLHLKPLAVDEALQFLRRIEPRLKNSATEIARLCDYLPLALRFAGSALVIYPDLQPDDYVARLMVSEERLSNLDSLQTGTGEHLGIESCLLLSHDLLSLEAQKMWRQLWVFPATFDLFGAMAIWEIEYEPAQQLLSSFVSQSMIEWNAQTRRYHLHDLVRLFAEKRLDLPTKDALKQRHAAYYKRILFRANQNYREGGERQSEGLRLVDSEWENIAAAQAWAAHEWAAHSWAAHSWAEQPTYAEAGIAVLCIEFASAFSILDVRLPKQAHRFLLEQAVQAAQRVGDKKAEVTLMRDLGSVLAALGEPYRAIEVFQQVLQMSETQADPAHLATIWRSMGTAYADLGNTHQAIECYNHALASAVDTGDQRTESSALNNLGNASWFIGDLEKARQYFEQSIAIAQSLGDVRQIGTAYGNLGNVYLDQKLFNEATACYRKHLEMSRKIGDRRGEAGALANLGDVYNEMGQHRRALKYCLQSLEITKREGYRGLESVVSWSAGHLYAKLNDIPAAVRCLENMVEYLTMIGHPDATMKAQYIEEFRQQK